MHPMTIPSCPPGHQLTFAEVDGERRIVAVPVTPAELEARQRHREAVDAGDRRSRERRARWLEADWRACIALQEVERAENATARARAQASPGLCAVLLEEAQRRGQPGIDWPEYFRNAHISTHDTEIIPFLRRNADTMTSTP